MGITIILVSVQFENGKVKSMEEVIPKGTSYDEFGLTYNFTSRYSEICEKHCDERGDCDEKCKTFHLWRLSDCSGKTAYQCKIIISKVLGMIKSFGIPVWLENNDRINYHGNYGYGIDITGALLPFRERLSVLAYHLTEFYRYIENHPSCYVIDENTDYLITPSGNKIKFIYKFHEEYCIREFKSQISREINNGIPMVGCKNCSSYVNYDYSCGRYCCKKCGIRNDNEIELVYHSSSLYNFILDAGYHH